MTKEQFYLGLAGGGLATGISGMIFSAMSMLRMKRILKPFQLSLEELDKIDMHDVIAKKITDELVEELTKEKIEQELERKVPQYISSEVKSAMKDIRKDFSDKVQREINDQYDDIKTEVREAVKSKVGAIDISDVKKQVILEAKAEAVSKFKRDLDNVLDDYNNQLEDVGKIYTSIAKKFSDK